MSENLLSVLEKEKLIAIIRGVEKEKLIPLCNALYKGGVRFVEITFKNDEDVILTSEKIRLIKENFLDKMYVGAGTVLTEKQVKIVKKAGGEFIVSPNVNKEIIKKTKRLNMLSIPGAFTPTEIIEALNSGADLIKLFPASTVSSKSVKAICAPLKNAKLLAFGGVDLNNIKEYKDAGAFGFGIGAGIIDKDLLNKNDFNGIENLARKFVSEIKK